VVRLFAAIVVVLTLPAALSAQKPKAPRASKSATTTRPAVATPFVPNADSLSAISRRGRTIAEYDRVTWLATGAMTLPSSYQNSVRKLIARQTATGWEVALGELTESGNEFRVSTIATPGMQTTWASQVFDPPVADTGYFARAARAIETALVMFHPVARRPYIATAVPAEDGPWWWVYVYPSPLQEGVWPRGGDMRFRVSADGRVITESRRLHDEITEYSVRSARMTAVTADGLSILKGNVPEDTDVFHILQRRPALPELMTAGKHRYRIDVDGRITILSPQ
jgi:hypothetical protein